ncbi:uncharacterized protein LOC141543848 [Sminthopsis crassicaudata]|uniref:uncharacterized protein LOC141543848 n=1 Tax=Sminthopsis crassicaudata TaxID=9301 RepID=UPI003D69EAB7
MEMVLPGCGCCACYSFLDPQPTTEPESRPAPIPFGTPGLNAHSGSEFGAVLQLPGQEFPAPSSRVRAAGGEPSRAGAGGPRSGPSGAASPPEGFHLHVCLELRSEPGPQTVPRVPPRPPPFGRVGLWEGASLLLPPPPSGAQPRPRPQPPLQPPLRWSRLSGPPNTPAALSLLRPRLPGYLLRADCPTRAEGLTPWTAGEGGKSAGPLQVKWFGIEERSPGTPDLPDGGGGGGGRIAGGEQAPVPGAEARGVGAGGARAGVRVRSVCSGSYPESARGRAEEEEQREEEVAAAASVRQLR